MESTHLVADAPLAASPSLARRAGRVGLGVVGFAVACRLLIGGLPPARGTDVEVKLAAFRERADEYDTVVLGSSLVARGVDPVELDRALAEQGVAARTFNFGVPGMYAFEQRAVLEEVLRSAGGRLRRVVVAPDFLVPGIPDDQVENQRLVQWHDPRGTLLAMRGVLARPGPWRAKATDLCRHARAFVLHAAGIGEVRRRVEDVVLPGDGLQETELLGPDGRGFVLLEDLVRKLSPEESEAFRESHRELLERADEFRAGVASGGRKGVGTTRLGDVEVDYLEGVVAAIERAGAVPVLLALPGNGLDYPDWLGRAHAAGVVPHYVDLSSPAEHPELYALENRFDRFHVNAAGARLLTRALARELAPILRAADEAGR